MRLVSRTSHHAATLGIAAALAGPLAPRGGDPGASERGGFAGRPDPGDERADGGVPGGGSGSGDSDGGPADGRAEQFPSAVPAAGVPAADAVEIDAVEIDAMTQGVTETILPLRGLSGLPIPRFGPDAATSVLMPDVRPEGITTALEATAAALGLAIPPVPASGKRKPPKTFKVPGQRGSTGVTVTNGHIIPGDEGTRTATFHTQGRTLTAGLTDDGAAALAETLMAGGILQESDWRGSLEKSIQHGLARWINVDKGAESFQFLGSPLTLVYTDDSPAYSTGVRLPRWVDHFAARPDRPTGFFGLRFQSPPRPVHVRRKVQALEEAFPGVGYGILNLLQNAAVSGAQGYSFGWGMATATRWGMLDGADARLNRMLMGEEAEDDEGSDAFDDPYHFGDCVPAKAAMTPFKLELTRRAASQAKTTRPELLPVLSAAMELFAACRRAGTTFYSTNHCPFLSWQISVGERSRGRISQKLIDSLDRAPVWYTVWDSENDVMTRLVDDYTEFARSTMQYTDLTWMHCFQVGFAGKEPVAARRKLEARDRAVKKALRHNPDALSFYDPDYVMKPMPDGSVAHAVQALSLVMDILGATDRLLTLLHGPKTLIETFREEDRTLAASRIEELETVFRELETAH